jgi:threonine dehydrogenase-like Zn-dependent dehydrogenase
VVAYAPYGTDVGVYLNRHNRYVSAYPVGFGADFSGVVAELGPGVDNVACGDRVSALALDHCGACENCRTGRTNLCLDPKYTTVRRQTCCEEYTLVSARKLARLPPQVTFDDAAMLAGVVDALNAYEQMGVTPDQSIAVIGVGAMGLGAIAAARALGYRVVGVGGTGRRADLAERLDAAAVVRVAHHDEDVSAAALSHVTDGYKAIIETTTSEWGHQQAFAIAGLGAAIALTGGGALPATSWDFVNRELRVIGVRAGHHQIQALQLIAEGRLDLKPTIGARFPLERAAEAFAMLTGEHARDLGRIIIDCSPSAAGTAW